MWLIAEYLPTTLFSLRMSNATNAAAKTLLLPSPYCIKMALLNALFQRDGIQATEARFEGIKNLTIRVAPPEAAVVNGCFVKIQKLGDHGFGPAFALREYVAYHGTLRIALGLEGVPAEDKAALSHLLIHINQLGKRGGFVQILAPPTLHDSELDVSFAMPLGEGDFKVGTLLQPLDDMQPEATLPQINPFSDEKVTRAEVIRRNVPTQVNYQRWQTSKGYTSYRTNV